MVSTSTGELFEYGGDSNAFGVSRLSDTAKEELYSLSTRWIDEVLILPRYFPRFMKESTLICSFHDALRSIHTFLLNVARDLF